MGMLSEFRTTSVCLVVVHKLDIQKQNNVWDHKSAKYVPCITYSIH